MSGGSLAIRGSPSTVSVSLPNALTLSFERAFATFFSKRLHLLGRGLSGGELGELLDIDVGVPDVHVAQSA